MSKTLSFSEIWRSLGFVFDWEDILRTKRAIKAVYKVWATNIVSSADSLRVASDSMLDGLADRITAMAELKPV
jgi:hypothetical protein